MVLQTDTLGLTYFAFRLVLQIDTFCGLSIPCLWVSFPSFCVCYLWVSFPSLAVSVTCGYPFPPLQCLLLVSILSIPCSVCYLWVSFPSCSVCYLWVYFPPCCVFYLWVSFPSLAVSVTCVYPSLLQCCYPCVFPPFAVLVTFCVIYRLESQKII